MFTELFHHVHLVGYSAAGPKGVPELKAQAAKEYNYIYTGKNKDILDFEIAELKAQAAKVQNGPDKN